MHSNECFLMPWWSRNHPRLILDRFGKKHFFMKIFKFLTHMSEPTSTKTHMYIHNLVNLRVPRPRTTQYRGSENHQILPSRCWEKQKTKLKRDLNQEPKISRKCQARGKPSTWLPRGRLLEQIQRNKRAKNNDQQTNSTPQHHSRASATLHNTAAQHSITAQHNAAQHNTTNIHVKTH